MAILLKKKNLSKSKSRTNSRKKLNKSRKCGMKSMKLIGGAKKVTIKPNSNTVYPGNDIEEEDNTMGYNSKKSGVLSRLSRSVRKRLGRQTLGNKTRKSNYVNSKRYLKNQKTKAEDKRLDAFFAIRKTREEARYERQQKAKSPEQKERERKFAEIEAKKIANHAEWMATYDINNDGRPMSA